MTDVFFAKLLKIRMNKGNIEPDILFIPSQQMSYTKPILEAIAKSSHKYFVWLRPHPLEHQFQKDYETALKKYCLQGKVDFKTKLYDQICSSDLTVGVHSTVLLESLIAKIPMFHCPYLAYCPDSVFDTHTGNGFYLGECKTKEKLLEALDSPLNYYLNRAKGKPFERIISKFVHENAYKQDGKAHERSIVLMEEMLEEQKKSGGKQR